MAYLNIPPLARLHPEFNRRILPLIQQAKESKVIEDACDILVQENKEYESTINLDHVIDRLLNLKKQIRKQLVNRREITRQGIRALMTSEHQFIFSAAGVAKSLYANQMFSFFKNSSVFSIQFSPDTSPDDLFGAYDIEKFKKGEIYHNVEGSIVTNNFAFLDEFMDGSDKLLRSLLNVLLERRFISGNQVEEAILHSAIATSNYMRVSETTEALLDRFLYKSFITPSKDMYTLLRIDKVYNENAGYVVEPKDKHKIDIRELYYVKKIIKNKVEDQQIKIPIEINYLKNLVVVAFEEEMKKYREDYYISPRTITKSNDLLKANAMLDGRKIVNYSDVENLYYLFCTLNEPLDTNGELLSQDLFKKVFHKRLQFFEQIEKQIGPLLYIFDFMSKVHKKKDLLSQADQMLESLVQYSTMSDLFEKLKHPFMSKEDHSNIMNKQHLIDFVSSVKSDYREINRFRDKLLNFIKEIYRNAGY
jgi:MoxR-like ATPase